MADAESGADDLYHSAGLDHCNTLECCLCQLVERVWAAMPVDETVHQTQQIDPPIYSQCCHLQPGMTYDNLLGCPTPLIPREITIESSPRVVARLESERAFRTLSLPQHVICPSTCFTVVRLQLSKTHFSVKPERQLAL